MWRFMVNFPNQKVYINFQHVRFTWNYNKNIGFDVVKRERRKKQQQRKQKNHKKKKVNALMFFGLLDKVIWH